MIKVSDIYEFLTSRYPLETACDFDNPGLLIGDGGIGVKKALIALDCDIDAVNEAENQGCELIITHHPVIWNGLKHINAGDIAFELIKSGIAVISMHTNLDIAADGVNQRLSEILGLYDVEPFITSDGFPLLCGSSPVSGPEALAEHIKNRLDYGVRYSSGGREIKKALLCCGSGGDFLKDAIEGGFDALITADVKHDVFVSAINADISIFDAGHYASERVIVNPLSELLSKEFGDAEFIPFFSPKIKYA